MPLSAATQVGVAGASVVGVAFGLARYGYGLTMPEVRHDLGMSELVIGLIASGTFAGYLVGLLAAGWLASRRGPRAPTTVGSVCGTLGCSTVALAPSSVVLAAGAILAGSAAGWVWSSYSDIVVRIAPERRQPSLLAAISTGGGLISLGSLALGAALDSWRLVWAGAAVAAAVAGLLNYRSVPRLPREHRPLRHDGMLPFQRSILPPIVHALVYMATCSVYFTYATDAISSGASPAWASSALYIIIGVVGLWAFLTGPIAAHLGAARVAAMSMVAVGSSLALLGLFTQSLMAILASSALFGAGYMSGAAILAVWTAEVMPNDPGRALTSALVVGSAGAIIAPALLGALMETFGLPSLLLGTAAVSTSVGVAMALHVQRNDGRQLHRSQSDPNASSARPRASVRGEADASAGRCNTAGHPGRL